MSVILFFALVLSACAPASLPEAKRSTSTPQPTETPVDPQQAYTNQDYGFSLKYPTGFEAQQPFAHMFTFMASESSPAERGLMYLEVERGLDQNAAWYANQAQQENANLGIQISSTLRTIDGQPAYILGHMPGQDLNRQVFIVYEGFLYHLTFLPDDPQMGEAYQQMETLYASVTHSLHFLPTRQDVPPVLSINNMTYQLERAWEARSEDEITRLLGDDFFVGNWLPQTPEGATFASYARNETGRLILDQYLSQSPDLTLEKQVDWTRLFGDPFPFSRFFPDQVIYPVLVKGWGPQGSDEAVLIIGQRRDGSKYWRGIFVTQGTFAQ